MAVVRPKKIEIIVEIIAIVIEFEKARKSISFSNNFS
tara:strand:+ start:241 stop:351 length:111 start_codon:yes stop_codon:yes gene_type:complete